MKWCATASAIGTMVACVFLLGCSDNNAVHGNGNSIMQEGHIQDFSGVDVIGNEVVAFVYCAHRLMIRVRYADSSSVQVRADENLLPYIQIKNEGSRLHIELLKTLKSNQDISVLVSKPYNKLTSTNVISTSLSGCAEIIWDLGPSK